MKQDGLGTCQVVGCKERARYSLFKQVNGSKQWLHVCPKHNGVIATENLNRAKWALLYQGIGGL